MWVLIEMHVVVVVVVMEREREWERVVGAMGGLVPGGIYETETWDGGDLIGEVHLPPKREGERERTG